MIDLNDLRNNCEKYRISQKARQADENLVDKILVADSKRRETTQKFETLRAKQNSFGKNISKASGEQKQTLLLEAKNLAQQVKLAQTQAEETKNYLHSLVKKFPNLVQPQTPNGGEENFKTLRTVGTIRDFKNENFTPKDHLEIGELLAAIDMERGAKVAGSRFYFLKGIGARLEWAMCNMALDQAIAAGFTPMITPALVRPEIMAGTGFLGEHSAEVYHLGADDLYLTGTSEVALAGYHCEEILDLSKEPKRYVGVSSCFRREAGSHGKDTRGIIRVHQFNKIEMFSYINAEDAVAEHERLLFWEEQMLQKMELPYRVIDVAAGDLGDSAARKYDCEAWIPSQNTYRELTSTSNCTTFQARRLNIRQRVAGSKNTVPVATLNGTLATTRWLVAILENHQLADGSVKVPKALQPYLGNLEVMPIV